MHLLSLSRVLGTLLAVMGASQGLPALAAAGYGEADVARVFALTGGAVAVAGLVMSWLSRRARDITERDGFAVVTGAWMSAAVMGALPYYFTGTVPGVTDALFESMSGFTTTGASVFVDYDQVSHGIFLWRSLTQWFGGMGIIVLALVILPALGIGGMELYKREAPGPYSEKLTPRIRDTAKALWSIYLGLTAFEAAVLMALGMTPFDAVNHALTTVSTGGFSPHPQSVGGYGSVAIEWTVIGFMFLGGTNFALHYRFLTGRGRMGGYFRDLEWLWYAGVVVAASLAVAGFLAWQQGYGAGAALTKGTFQLVSILTTTGYGSDDYVLWGAFPQILLLLAMIVGGSAGSTAGGVKWIRILLIFKFIYLEMLRLIHPRVVIHVKVRHVRVTPDILSNIFAFLFLYLTILAAATLLIALDGHSIATSIGAAAAALGNIGPGLDAVGPMENYAALSAHTKWLLIGCMLLGRLEVMTVLVLLMPRVWSR